MRNNRLLKSDNASMEVPYVLYRYVCRRFFSAKQGNLFLYCKWTCLDMLVRIRSVDCYLRTECETDMRLAFGRATVVLTVRESQRRLCGSQLWRTLMKCTSCQRPKQSNVLQPNCCIRFPLILRYYCSSELSFLNGITVRISARTTILTDVFVVFQDPPHKLELILKGSDDRV
jgi:hypothetical protein